MKIKQLDWYDKEDHSHASVEHGEYDISLQYDGSYYVKFTNYCNVVKWDDYSDSLDAAKKMCQKDLESFVLGFLASPTGFINKTTSEEGVHVRAVSYEELEKQAAMTRPLQEAFSELQESVNLKPVLNSRFTLCWEVENWAEWSSVFGDHSPTKFNFPNGLQIIVIKKI